MTHLKSNELIIFVHIRKTGGSTLQEIINRQYRSSYLYRIKKNETSLFLALSKERKDAIRVLTGHGILGFHNHFTKKVIYITLLRNPVERFISSYYHYLTKLSPDIELKKNILNSSSLSDYIQSEVFPNEENYQTRALSGNLDTHDSCTIEMLNIAKKNIDERFELVGITECFDEFLIMLMLKLRWRYPFYRKLNVRYNRPQKADIDKETLQIIEKYNQLDIELYQYVKFKLENQLKLMDDSFYKKLEMFKKLNRALVPLIRIASSIKQFLIK